MAEASFTQLRTRQDRRLRDTTDKTFSSSEKDEFLTTAIDDPYVFKIVKDTSLTSVTGQATYTVPDGISEVIEMAIDLYDNDFPEIIDRNGYEVVDGTIYFDRNYRYLLDGKILYVTGKYKLTTSDLIPDYLQEYVLRLADINAYEELIASFTTRFLKNDVTMADLQGAIRGLQIRVADLRKNLANRREVRG